MDAHALCEVLELHQEWLLGEGSQRVNLTDADLAYADLHHADLSHADLRGADLSHADLRGAHLTYANLRDANLTDANLTDANLTDVDLRGANLADANLADANLADADLSHADLADANLTDADLTRANLTDAQYNVCNVLAMDIGAVSDGLTLELMRWDATVCGIDAMNAWAMGGACPFSGNLQRPFQFTEQKALWESGKPERDLMELWQAVAKEKNITI